MKILLSALLFALVAFAGTSCTTLDQTNTDYSKPYRKAVPSGFYGAPRVDPYGAPGIWDVRQGGGSTGIAYRN